VRAGSAAELAGHPDLGALRLRLIATKDRPCPDFPYCDTAGDYLPEVVLDFWGLVQR
jgi:2-methylfumaryl-CoA hydratase